MVLAWARLIGDLHSVIIQVHYVRQIRTVWQRSLRLICLNDGLEITEMSVLDRESQLIFVT